MQEHCVLGSHGHNIRTFVFFTGDGHEAVWLLTLQRAAGVVTGYSADCPLGNGAATIRYMCVNQWFACSQTTISMQDLTSARALALLLCQHINVIVSFGGLQSNIVNA